MMPRQICLREPVANLRISPQCARSAAGHVGQHQIESFGKLRHCRIAVQHINPVGQRWLPHLRQAPFELRHARRIHLASHNAHRWIARRKNQRLSARRGAQIQHVFA